jgi:hypothetical protein
MGRVRLLGSTAQVIGGAVEFIEAASKSIKPSLL